MKNEEIKEIIQSANINFLIGSGLSRDFLVTLGNIETLLTDLYNKYSKGEVDENQKMLIEASLLYYYFDQVMYKNLKLIKNEADLEKEKTIKNYSTFLKYWNTILQRRRSTILNNGTIPLRLEK
jgi:hypothetical protein